MFCGFDRHFTFSSEHKISDNFRLKEVYVPDFRLKKVWKHENISYGRIYHLIQRSCDSGYSGRFEFHGKSTVFGRAGSSPVDRVFVLNRYERARRTKWDALERYHFREKKCKKVYQKAISLEFEEKFEEKRGKILILKLSYDAFREKKKPCLNTFKNCTF